MKRHGVYIVADYEAGTSESDGIRWALADEGDADIVERLMREHSNSEYRIVESGFEPVALSLNDGHLVGYLADAYFDGDTTACQDRLVELVLEESS